MTFPRIIVAQAPPPAGVSTARLPVGVLRWADPIPTLTILIKVTLSFGEDAPVVDGVTQARLIEEHEPLSLNRLVKGPGGAEELVYPSDFVPLKRPADLLLRGHGHGGVVELVDDQPTTRIIASITVGEEARSFHLVAAGRVAQIPLSPPYLRDSSGAEVAPVGPIATPALLSPLAYHHPDFDFSAYNAAAPAQRIDDVEPGTTIRLENLSPRARDRTLVLPDLVARAFVEYREQSRLVERNLFADTLFLDTDRERLTLVYRGHIELTHISAAEIARLVVAMDRASGYRSVDDMFRALPRGEVFYAITAADLEPGAPPVPDRTVELKMARYATWGYPEPAEPITSLERYAAIGAAMTEGREPRAEVFRRHEVDGESWVVEERAWGAKLSADRALAQRYGELFVAAQDALAEPHEAQRGIDDYRKLAAALERRPLHDVLREAKMTQPAWQRLKRRCSAELRRQKAEQAQANHKALPPMPAIKALAPAPTLKALAPAPRKKQES